MSLISDWRKWRSVRKMATRLPTILATSYGASEDYTIAQIRVAFGRLKLDARYIDFAFAAYLPFETYAALTAGEQASYEAARSLYRRYLPDGSSSSAEPSPVNAYIRQISGL